MADKRNKDLLKELENVRGLLQHLEDEYRKANISEKDYKEAREKYLKKVDDLEKKLGLKKDAKSETKEEKPEEPEIEVGEVEEMTPEVIEKLAQQVAAASSTTPTEEKEVEEAPAEEPAAARDVEIEKLKMMIDVLREADRATEESIRTLSESIGEIRSTVFQTDGSLQETVAKLEKLEDDVAGIRPKEIDKKFVEVNEALEKQQMLLEKFEKKNEDLSTKINEVHKMLKEVGGIENLAELSKDIRNKIDEMKEALKYTERLAFKTEKIFIDLNKRLEEFVVYKTRVDGLNETVNELMKSIDGLNVKIENLPTKKDLEVVKVDILTIQKEVEEIKKILPIVEAKLPETITSLREERKNILLFLDSLEEQLRAKRISVADYEDVKRRNLEKLMQIEENLRKEWERIEEFISKGGAQKAEEGKSEAKEQEPKPESKEVEKPKPKEEVQTEKEIPKSTEEEPEVRVEHSEEKWLEPQEKESRDEMVEILRKIRGKIK